MTTSILRERLEAASVADAFDYRFRYKEKKCIGLGGYGVVYQEPYELNGLSVLQKVTLITKESSVHTPLRQILPLDSIIYDNTKSNYGQILFTVCGDTSLKRYDLCLGDIHALKLAVAEYSNLREVKGIEYFAQSVTDIFAVDDFGKSLRNDREFFLLDGQLCVRTMMSKVPGKTVDSLISEQVSVKKLNYLDVVKIAYDTACALSILGTDKRIVHRDVSPANIIYNHKYDARGDFVCGEGNTFIIDFGSSTRERVSLDALVDGCDISLLLKSDDLGYTSGTMGFMSPEQFDGKEVNRFSDRWSLGCVLYALMTNSELDLEIDQLINYNEVYHDEILFNLVVNSKYNLDLVSAVGNLFDCVAEQRKIEPLIGEAKEILAGRKSCLRSTLDSFPTSFVY